MNETEINAIR